MQQTWNFDFYDAWTVVASASMHMSATTARWRAECEAKFPDFASNARMDSVHIKEVLVHLIENAAKYSPPRLRSALPRKPRTGC